MKDILKYGIWTGLYLILLIPFFVANSMFFPYITGKGFAFRIITEIIFGLWLILIIKTKEFRPKFSWVMGSVALLVFILLLADINAVAPYKAFWSNYERMEGFVTFVHLLAYFLVIGSMFNTEKLWLWFLRVNVFLGMFLAIQSLTAGAKENVIRIAGPLGNPIYIAVYFLFISFITLILLYKDVLAKNLKSWLNFKKIFYDFLFYLYILIASLSVFVVYRASRGALLGLVGGILVCAILIIIFEKPARPSGAGGDKKVIRQIAIGGIIAIIILTAGFFSIKERPVVQNNPTLKRLSEVSWKNLNGQARQLVWPMAIKGFQEKPLLGWGQEGFNYVFNKYYDPGMYEQETWFDRAHNAPLDFLVAGGILGLLAYLGLFISAIYLLWFRINNLDITEKSLLTGLLAGYLFQAIFVFDNLISYLLFIMILAYIHSRMVEKEEHKKAFNVFSNFVSNEEYQNYILIPLITVLTVFGVWQINIPAIQANQTVINSFRLIQMKRWPEALESFQKALAYDSMGTTEIREQLLTQASNIILQAGIEQKVKQDFFDLTILELEKQIDTVPNDARYYILFSSFLGNTGNFESALEYINKAIELSPKKQQMRFQKINILLNLNRIDEALAEAKFTYELDTNYKQAKSIYEALLEQKN